MIYLSLEVILTLTFQQKAHSEYLKHFFEKILLLASGTWMMHRGMIVTIEQQCRQDGDHG